MARSLLLYPLAIGLLTALHLQQPGIASPTPPLQEIDVYLSPFIVSYPPIPGCHSRGQSSTLISALARQLGQGASLQDLADHLACQTAASEVGRTEQANLRMSKDSPKGAIPLSCKAPLRQTASDKGDDTKGGPGAHAIRLLQSEDEVPPERMQNMVDTFLGDLKSISSIVGVSAISLCIWAELRKDQGPNPTDPITGTALSGIPNLGNVLCKCQAKSNSEKGKCSLVNSALLSLGCVSEGELTCPFQGTITPPYVPEGVSLPMQPLKSTPNAIPDDVIAAEAVTYRNLITAIFSFYNRVGSYPCKLAGEQGDTDYEKPIFDGWVELKSFTAIEEGIVDTRQQLPLAILSTRPNEKDASLHDYLIVVRGTATEGEWRLNFSYDQILGELLRFPGGVHRGFASIALILWPAIQSVLGKSMREGKLGYVTVTGHSLGGGVASILSYLVGSYVSKNNSKLTGPTTRAVLFAPPHSGTPKFVEALGATVNLRAIVAELDPIVAIPCEKMTECPDLGGDKGEKLTYAKYPGRIVIGASFLGYPWTEEEASTNIMAWHVCPYACWASKLTMAAGLTSDLYFCDKPIVNRPFTADMCPRLVAVPAERISGSSSEHRDETQENGPGVIVKPMVMGGAPSFTLELEGLPSGEADPFLE